MSKETYPRIVTNGGRYRIEIGHHDYDYSYGITPCAAGRVWETRFISRAIKRLAVMRKDEAHYNPDNWRAVL